MNRQLSITGRLARIALWLLVATASAETPFVKITSPAAGTVVHPGDRVVVTVQATPHVFESVQLQTCRGAHSEPPAIARPPYQFVLRIPASSDVESGSCGLLARGWPLSDAPIDFNNIATDVVEVDIERSESPERLRSQSLEGSFHHVGDILWLQTTGVSGDGSNVNLTRSTKSTYETSAPSVATVNSAGFVTAVGPGSASITVRNGHASTVVPMVVPVD